MGNVFVPRFLLRSWRAPPPSWVSAVEISTSVASWLWSYRGELFLVVCTALRRGQSNFFCRFCESGAQLT